MVEVAQTRESQVDATAGNAAVARASHYLLGIQYPDGYWWGELESNPTMEAEFLLLNHFLGIKDADRWRKLANHILGQQRSDGTWGQYYGAQGDLSTTTECYFALKLAGIVMNMIMWSYRCWTDN